MPKLNETFHLIVLSHRRSDQRWTEIAGRLRSDGGCEYAERKEMGRVPIENRE